MTRAIVAASTCGKRVRSWNWESDPALLAGLMLTHGFNLKNFEGRWASVRPRGPDGRDACVTVRGFRFQLPASAHPARPQLWLPSRGPRSEFWLLSRHLGSGPVLRSSASLCLSNKSNREIKIQTVFRRCVFLAGCVTDCECRASLGHGRRPGGGVPGVHLCRAGAEA